MNKSKVVAKLNFIPSPELREQINKTISENRGLPIEVAKYKKYVRPNEVEILFEFYGVENTMIK